MKYKYALSALGLVVLQACTPEDRGSSQEAPGSAANGAAPPNILLIVADDLGFTDMGAFGSEISTPNLDRLAQGGLRLANLHAASYCRPARLMLMSGAGAVAANQPMPESHRGGALGLNYATIAELLQDAGYATYVTGKWDLGDIGGYTPDARGFDRSFVQTGGSANYFPELFLGRAFGYQEDGRELTPQDVAEDFYSTRAYTDKMLEYLRSTDDGTPWFAYMPYTAPHWPLQLPEDWLDRYAGRYDDGYDALRERRFERARETGVLPASASLVNFERVAEPWSDLSPEEQRRYSRAQEIYAGMVEYLDMSVGRIVDYPSAIRAGGVSDAFMTFMDILPTIMEIAGPGHPGAGPYRDGREIEDIVGRSAWPHFTGKAPGVHAPTDAAGWVGTTAGGILIRGNRKIINEPPPGGTESTPWRLYDLAEDPGETRDLAAESPEFVAELVREWEANWR